MVDHSFAQLDDDDTLHSRDDVPRQIQEAGRHTLIFLLGLGSSLLLVHWVALRSSSITQATGKTWRATVRRMITDRITPGLPLKAAAYTVIFSRYTIATFLSSFFTVDATAWGISDTVNGLIFAGPPAPPSLCPRRPHPCLPFPSKTSPRLTL